jgi:hypothetical protein
MACYTGRWWAENWYGTVGTQQCARIGSRNCAVLSIGSSGNDTKSTMQREKKEDSSVGCLYAPEELTVTNIIIDE